jgi:hypothetical protein
MSGATPTKTVRKDQERALDAYRWAKQAADLKDYEIAVQSFAASLLRGGLAVAVSVLERSKKRSGFAHLLTRLAAYPAPGILLGPAEDWPERVRGIADTTSYMQATREFIALAAWLRRACRALGAD